MRQGGVGLYTAKWGVLRDHQVTDGQKNKTRMVVVRNGVVTQNIRRFPKPLDVKGKVLIGRDQGALALRGPDARAPGSRSRPRSTPSPQVAITGNVFLMRDGKKLAQDDRDLHPRTALGITEDRTGLILLVVDGRETFSRGLHDGRAGPADGAARLVRGDQPRRRRLLDDGRPQAQRQGARC